MLVHIICIFKSEQRQLLCNFKSFMNRVTNITNTNISELSLEHCGTLQMVQLAEDSAVYMKAMVVQAEYNKEKDAYRELLFLTVPSFLG